MTRRDLIESALVTLTEAGVDDARRNAEWMLEEATGDGRAAMFAKANLEVEENVHAQFDAMVERRAAREPVQYILGHADFYHLRLAVTPDVLIPRPETEELVEEALRVLERMERPWVLDVGTGSGAIALAVKAECPTAEVFAVDLSTAALAVAAGNATALGLDVMFVQADVLRPQFADEVPPTFDLILSNPPYVPAAEHADLQPEVRDHEPALALFVEDTDPLRFYRALAGHAERLLRPGGRMIVETHADHGAAVRDLFEASGLPGAALLRDLSGRPRMVSTRRP